MVVVLMHGRAQTGIKAEKLKNDWCNSVDLALEKLGRARLDRSRVLLPYYAELLAEHVLTYVERMQIQRRGGDPKIDDPDWDVFFDRAARELEFALRQETELRGNGITSNPIVGKLARLVDGAFPEATIALMNNFLLDAYVYLTQSHARQQVSNLVFESLPRDEPIQVISHSLGSVVAFDLFSKIGERENDVTLITIGSPLGLAALRSHLTAPLEAPRNLRLWVNVRDSRDIVALKPIPGNSLLNSMIIEDVIVDNIDEDPHSAIGYLKQTTVASLI